MRLDKFLKSVSLVKRRSVAKSMIVAGRVLVNKRKAKPSYEVKTGDEIEIFFGNRYVRIRVVAGGYEVLESEYVARD